MRGLALVSPARAEIFATEYLKATGMEMSFQWIRTQWSNSDCTGRHGRSAALFWILL
jgi:hypothetical protein